MDGFSRPKKVHHGNRIGIVTRMSLFGLRGDLIEISFDLICTSYVTNWGLSGRSLTAGESQIIISWRASIHQSRHESAEHPRTTLSIADCRQGCHRATLILALSSAGMKATGKGRRTWLFCSVSGSSYGPRYNIEISQAYLGAHSLSNIPRHSSWRRHNIRGIAPLGLTVPNVS